MWLPVVLESGTHFASQRDSTGSGYFQHVIDQRLDLLDEADEASLRSVPLKCRLTRPDRVYVEQCSVAHRATDLRCDRQPGSPGRPWGPSAAPALQPSSLTWLRMKWRAKYDQLALRQCGRRCQAPARTVLIVWPQRRARPYGPAPHARIGPFPASTRNARSYVQVAPAGVNVEQSRVADAAVVVYAQTTGGAADGG